MNCTEVGELMQRQLDYDLDEHELTILMTHLGECKACQALFERLTLLSGSLEQLPRVTPSISIVDAILPELDAIDRQRAKERAKHSIWKRWMTAAASVAAAAAVVFVMTNLAEKSNQANDSANELAMMTNAGSATAGEGHDNTAKNEVNDQYTLNSLESLHEDTLVGTLQIEPLSSPIDSLHERLTQQSNSGEEGNSDPGTLDYAPAPTSITEPRSSTTNPNQSVGTSNSLEQDQHISEPEVGINKNAAENDQGSGQSDVKVTDQIGGSDESIQESFNEGNSGSDDDQFFGIASHDPVVEKYHSPDGKVYIAIEPHTIVLYETSTEQVLRTWDLAGHGTISSLEWAADSSSFSYEWNNESGESSLHVVSLEQE